MFWKRYFDLETHSNPSPIGQNPTKDVDSGVNCDVMENNCSCDLPVNQNPFSKAWMLWTGELTLAKTQQILDKW